MDLSGRQIPLDFSEYHVSETFEREFKYFALSEDQPGNICSCGHPERLHVQFCRLGCGCLKWETVMEVSDVKPFFQISEGPRRLHAFEKGRALSESLEIVGSMLVPWVCFRCGSDIEVWMAGLKANFQPTRVKPKLNKLMCDVCLSDSIQRNPIY